MLKLKVWLNSNRQPQDNPLTPHLHGFAKLLMDDGYAGATVKLKLCSLADFGQWLGQRRRVSLRKYDELCIEAFVKNKHRVRRGDSRTLQQFLDYLRQAGMVPNRKPVPSKSPFADILRQYEKYLRAERGLVPVTIIRYQPFVRNFLVERFRGQEFSLKKLKPSDISTFILRHGRGMNVRTAQLMTTVFRSFFRFLFQSGQLQANLAACVPTVANWRLSTVPKYLTPQEVRRVLKACNRRTATGRRDYAILLLLARLGLRAGEIVALQVEDIDWRAAEFVVRGKGLVHERMPMPHDVGKALVSYLRRDRPVCRTRRVFVCMRAPHRGFAGPSTLTTIVHSALERASLRPTFRGAHLLRHTLATSILRAGATMGEIGEILRHRSPNTTEIYAKVDFDGLRSLAHPWPMGGAL